MMPVHVVIPDTQVKPGVPTAHLTWIGQYIVDHFAGRSGVKLIHLGDHWDMPSLSSYDKGKKAMEGRRVMADFAAGNEGFLQLNEPLIEYNKQRAAAHRAQWHPEEKHFIRGNHEQRVERAIEADAQLEGILGYDKMETLDWTIHDFLDPTFIDGVGYAHFFANPMSGRPYGGMAITRLKTIGHSFTMGHQQTLDYAVRFVRDGAGIARSQHALVAGACYLHDEDYKGYQGNAHWRGIVVCHEVEFGCYDPMFVSLEYLCRRYEGVTISEYLKSIGYEQRGA